MKHDSLTAHSRDELGLSGMHTGPAIQTALASSTGCRNAAVEGTGHPAKFHDLFHNRVIMPVDNLRLERVRRTLEGVRSGHSDLDDVVARLECAPLPDTIV